MLPLLLASVPIANAPKVDPPALIANATEAGKAVAQATPQTAASTEASKQSYPYASIQAGVGFPSGLNGSINFLGLTNLENSLSLGTGFNGELAVGYKFPKFRTDLSVGYSYLGNQTQTVTSSDPNFGSVTVTGLGSVNLFTVMANLYYDFKIKKSSGELSHWSPYIGAGIGWGNLTTPKCSIDGGNCPLYQGGSASTFAYQGKIGVSYRATSSGFIFLEGGYLGTTAATVNNVGYNPLGLWRLNLGWRQRF